jgi:hypothetical protein
MLVRSRIRSAGLAPLFRLDDLSPGIGFNELLHDDFTRLVEI